MTKREKAAMTPREKGRKGYKREKGGMTPREKGGMTTGEMSGVI